MKYLYTAVLFSVILRVNAFADLTPTNDNAQRAVCEAMDLTAQHKGYSLDKLVAEFGTSGLPFIKQYLTNHHEMVRYDAYAYVWLVAKQATLGSIERQDLVRILLEGISDPSGFVNQQSPQWLMDFEEQDFSETSKAMLHDMLHTQRKAILLVGLANMTNELDFLAQIMDEELKKAEAKKALKDERVKKNPRLQKVYAKERPNWKISSEYWAALRARARMGVQEDAEQCVVLMDKIEGVNERVDRMKDLIYIRQPAAAVWLGKQLKSDEKAGWGHIPGTPIATIAATYLKGLLENFPDQQEGESEVDYIARCREWMDKQTDWKIIR